MEWFGQWKVSFIIVRNKELERRKLVDGFKKKTAWRHADTHFWKMGLLCHPTIRLIAESEDEKQSELRPKHWKVSLNQVSICVSVTDESQSLWCGELSALNADHSPPAIFLRLHQARLFGRSSSEAPVWERSSATCLSVIWKIDSDLKLHLLFTSEAPAEAVC